MTRPGRTSRGLLRGCPIRCRRCAPRDLEPVRVLGPDELLDLSRLDASGLPLLVGGIGLALGLRIGLDEDVARAFLWDCLAGQWSDRDLTHALLRRRGDDDLVAEVRSEPLEQHLLADVVAIRLVAHSLRRQDVVEPTLGGRLPTLLELEHGVPAIGLDGADDLSGLRIGQRVEIGVVGHVAILEPAELAAGRCGEVVADLGRDGGEVLAALDPLESRVRLVTRGSQLLLGRLSIWLRVGGQGRDQHEARADPLGKRQALRNLRVDLLVAHRQPELVGAGAEYRAIDQRVGRLGRNAVQALAEAVDLLLQDLVSRPTQLIVELAGLRDRLGGEDPLPRVEIAAREGLALHRSHRAHVGLPVGVPCRRSEDPQRNRDGDGEADDDELLGAQLVLPSRAVLPVEDRSGSDRHRLTLVMRRLGWQPGLARAGRGAILADAPPLRSKPGWPAARQRRRSASRIARIRSPTTSSMASRTMPPVIFDAPATRSRNTIGTSRTTAPRLCAHHVVSTWKP